VSEQLSPYQILGIPFGAAQKEIRNAYRTLAMKYHPDRNPADSGAEEKFKQVQWAYETLTAHTMSRRSVPNPTSRWAFAAGVLLYGTS
jgi:DnaJ-class molecular chaperone